MLSGLSVARLAPPGPGLAVDQHTDQQQHRHQRHLVSAGIGHEDVGHQMGNIGEGVNHADPEMGAAPAEPVAGPRGLAGGPGDPQQGAERNQEIHQHRPEQQSKPRRRHLGGDLR